MLLHVEALFVVVLLILAVSTKGTKADQKIYTAYFVLPLFSSHLQGKVT